MEEIIIGLLSSESLHIVLVGVIVMLTVAIVTLWRKNNQLIEKMLEVRELVTSVHDINVQQSREIQTIKRQTNGH